MELIKEADFRRELKAEPRLGYLFFGEEDYLKSFALNQARERICPDPTLAFFNDLRLDALDFTPQKLLDTITPMPMMADRKIITLTGMDFNALRAGEIEDLCEVLSELQNFDYNLLIISVAADRLDAGFLPKKPSSVLTKLSEYLTPVWFERCTTAKLTAWVGKHFAHNGVTASPALCAEMPEYCGHSMFVLANEIDKLSFYVRAHGKDTATPEEMRLVCSSADEFDAFAFANAIMEGNNETALAILSDYKFRRVDPLIILGDVTRVVCDLLAVQSMTAEGTPNEEIASLLRSHAYRIGLYQKSLHSTSRRRLLRALEACTAADAAIKGSTTSGYTVLERLICSI